MEKKKKRKIGWCATKRANISLKEKKETIYACVYACAYGKIKPSHINNVWFLF
jgi:hypothetical protein